MRSAWITPSSMSVASATKLPAPRAHCRRCQLRARPLRSPSRRMCAKTPSWLYGFLTEAERGWFRLLQSVQGVGAKVALSILSTLDVGHLANAIALQDKSMVTRAPGVGPKVALRIVNELKDKAPPLALVTTQVIGQAPSQTVKGGGIAPSRPRRPYRRFSILVTRRSRLTPRSLRPWPRLARPLAPRTSSASA